MKVMVKVINCLVSTFKMKKKGIFTNLNPFL